MKNVITAEVNAKQELREWISSISMSNVMHITNVNMSVMLIKQAVITNAEQT